MLDAFIIERIRREREREKERRDSGFVPLRIEPPPPPPYAPVDERPEERGSVIIDFGI